MVCRQGEECRQDEGGIDGDEDGVDRARERGTETGCRYERGNGYIDRARVA